MKKVLVLGTKNYDYDLFDEFKSIGLECFFCGNKKSNLIPDEYWINIDFTDTEKIIKFIIQNPNFKYVIPGSNDLAYLSACKVIERLEKKNLIKIDNERVAENYLLKSKFRSQKFFKKVLVPKTLSLKKLQYEKKKFVIKQDKTSGGKGVFIFKNGEHFDKCFDIKNLKTNYVLEEYIDGSGHGISYVIKEGKIIFEFYDDEYYCKDKLAVVATTTPSTLSIEQKNKIRHFSLNYFKNFKLVDGFFHIQCIRKNDEIYIIECTRRLPGDYYHEFCSLSLGKSYLQNYIKSFIGDIKIDEVDEAPKNIVRVVLDDLIISEIRNSIKIENLIKKHLLKKRKLDGFRVSENKKNHTKKEAIFLQFQDVQKSINFCKQLLKNI